MKRIAPFLLLLLALAVAARGFDGQIGFLYGLRTLKDADLRGVFGTGTVAVPSLAIRLSRGVYLGLAYEAGYSREAAIGLFGDLFSLSVSGFEIFLKQEWSLGPFTPYLKIGPGLALYKIHISSPFLTAYNVTGKDISFQIAAGTGLRLGEHIALAAEGKYSVLRIDPYDDRVDLGGFRLLGGLTLGF